MDAAPDEDAPGNAANAASTTANMVARASTSGTYGGAIRKSTATEFHGAAGCILSPLDDPETRELPRIEERELEAGGLNERTARPRAELDRRSDSRPHRIEMPFSWHTLERVLAPIV